MMAADIATLIRKGGVYHSMEGSTPEEIYKKFTDSVNFPPAVNKTTVYEALCAREKIMSTAVGNGIALPHARASIITSEDDQRVSVVYLKEPIDMKAPDEIKVYVMFILLTQNPQTHLQILSTLAGLFRKPKFRSVLERRASEEQILAAVNELS